MLKTASVSPSPPLDGPYAPPDEEIAVRLLTAALRSPAAEARLDARTTRLIEGIRGRTGGLGGIEDFLPAYSLATREGRALLVLAEAVLPVPGTAHAFPTASSNPRSVRHRLTTAMSPSGRNAYSAVVSPIH